MNRLVCPDHGRNCPAAATVSSTRTEVVPTATILPWRARHSATARTVASGNWPHSWCMTCRVKSSS